ncbi:MAG: RICIN domain-containing protein [Ruminococcus sp.]|nr:RICIN domain-containing protein [Ruminococcus sp.]
MKFHLKKGLASIAALVTGFTSTGFLGNIQMTNIVSAANGNYVVEKLDRGISAINTGSGMLVNWRLLANDSANVEFKLYRDNNLIYTSKSSDATCFLDKSGSATSTYKVESLENGAVVSSDVCNLISNNNYFDVNLDVPKSSSCTYSPNDCSVGDVDGDGVYELFVKWDPSNSKDNSQKGKTGNVYIDCYKLNGQKLWRIDLGCNIRAGAHYTQFLVADFDCDGYAEMTCKTADGTVDGQGNVIGDASKDYRNSNGYILTGPEYYTLFDGLTGKALDTVDYNPQRGDVSKWGDKYGNRVDRFLGAVAYLDGVHPSAVTLRGYYTRMTACAYDVVDKKLVQRWYFDTGNSSSTAGYGDGNHNCMPADVDGDGKQEILTGGNCIDDNGKLLWTTNLGHGDAIHVGDLLPDRDGIEVWTCHEDKPYGVSLIDGKTGKIIFHKDGASDTGRCCADNVWTGNDGAELWGLGNDVFDGNGNTLSCRRPAINFLSYWDGDLEREILDGYTDSPATISKMGADGKLTTLLSTDGYYTCNTTKGTPCLSADIFGDWREELIVRASNSKSIRIYCTPYDTDYRITTLMHNPQYRNQVAGQNVAYNQPPHLSFYLGSEKAIPAPVSVTVCNNGTTITPPQPTRPTGEVMDTTAKYMFKNVGSGLYLEVANAEAANGANVQQWGADGEAVHNTWKLFDAGDGYYTVRSCVGDGKTYFLDLDMGKFDNGTNIGIYQDTNSTAQHFKFVKNSDGTYTITTRVTEDKSCIGVQADSTKSGANIIQWEQNGKDSQKWTLEKITIKDGATLDTDKCYMIQNVNSGLYMEVEGGKQENGTNVQQWGANTPSAHNVWHLKYINWGYYYIYSALGDGESFVLNLNDGKNGSNITIDANNKQSSQYFKFVDNEDGTYTIVTRASRDLSCIEIANSNKGSGGNVQQYELNGLDCQKWKLIPVDYNLPSKTVLGDINQSGKIDLNDIVLLQQFLIGKTTFNKEQSAVADMNGDGNINIFDLSILKYKN